MSSPEEHADAQHGVSVANVELDASTVHEAAAANEAERNMGLRQSFKVYRKACLWSLFFSTCIIMEGYDILLLKNLFAYPPFQRQFGEQLQDGSYQLTAAWQSGLSNASLVGQILGLLFIGVIADRFGYRKTLMGALVGCIFFIFVLFFSRTLGQLLAGEILLGLMLGAFQTMTTTYASEVCPTHLRAYLTTYVNLCWVIGQFIGSGVLRGMLERDDQWGYRIPFALQWIWPVPLIVGIWFAPESPWWLVRTGRIEEAKKSLARLTTPRNGMEFNVNNIVSMMIHTNELEKEVTAGTSYLDLFKGVNLRRTEIACMVWMIQTLSGSNFMGYSTYFYEQAGLDVSNAFNLSLAQYAIGAVGTMSSWFLMSRFGRRRLYFTGQSTLFVILFVTGCTSFAGKDNSAAKWATGSMLLVFTLIYDSTVGPVCYSLVTELCSTRLRTKTVVLARSMYNVMGILANIITPRMLNPSAWGWGAKAGFFWAGSCFICAIWSFFRLPEPKGRTYNDIDTLFERKVSARQFSKVFVERIDAQTVDEKSGRDEVRVETVGEEKV